MWRARLSHNSHRAEKVKCCADDDCSMMSWFYLKMILTHGFIGSTCSFRIRIYCFAFSLTPLQMRVPRFFSSIMWGTRFFCSTFGYLLVIFWSWSSHFSFSQWAWCTMAILLFEMGVMYHGHSTFCNGRDVQCPCFLFTMGVMYHGQFPFRNGRDVPWPFFFL